MSIQTFVRSAQTGTLDFEGQVFGYAFELMEQASAALGVANPMGFAVNEDALLPDDEYDALLEALGDDEDEEEMVDRLLTGRGDYFDRETVLASLRACAMHFEGDPDARAGKAVGRELALDLRAMIEAIESAAGDVRIYLA